MYVMATCQQVKTVTIAKDETTSVDFSEVQSDPVKMGAVNFSVTPKGRGYEH